jgi:HAE1 family hydrophobic/amphiphilic exporter-1
MTALTTILAMFQLIFSDDMAGQLGSGMAIVIVGGMVYGTLMTLIIVPVIYDIVFKHEPRNVDIGGDNLDDVPDDAAEFIAQALAEKAAEEAALADAGEEETE